MSSTEFLSQFMHYGVIALQVFGVTSILGVIGFLTAYYAFPPNISLDEVKDKSKNNFESRLVLKNIGKTPAFRITFDVSEMNFVVDGLRMTNMSTTDCGVPITRLAAGEKTDIPAMPHVAMPVGSNLQSCDYKLNMKYELRLPFYKKLIEKSYYVELRDSVDEFVWQISMR